jgi:hypothetical protein
MAGSNSASSGIRQQLWLHSGHLLYILRRASLTGCLSAAAAAAATAMKPRMLLTLDAEGQLLSVPVRLGQAVDVVAQAGRPKTITGGFLGGWGCVVQMARGV